MRTQHDRVSKLSAPGLYLVTDDRLAWQELLARTRAALDAGVRVLQYRDKAASTRELLSRGEQLYVLCEDYQALFLVNDRLDVALALRAAGLHLGQDDFPAERARALIGSAPLLGVSISHLEEALRADAPDVDYLGVGAMYPTGTKLDAEYAGLDLLRAVRQRVQMPLVGIGGITLERAAEVIRAGADAVAVVSAVYLASDSASAAGALIEAIATARRR
jgi:thiamine-phosphate diphosphorylase